MQKKYCLCRLLCLLVVIGLFGSTALVIKGSGSDQDIAAILSEMYTLVSNDFSTEAQDAALSETAFADNWSVILAGGGSAVVKSGTDGSYVQLDKYNEICSSYENIYGKRVKSEVVSYADCFSVYDDEDVIEVYSSIIKCSKDLPEDSFVNFFEESSSRKELLPLRRWLDPEQPDETND